MGTEHMWIYFSGTFFSLVKAQAKAGYLEESQSTLDEACAIVKKIDERYWEAELYRPGDGINAIPLAIF